MNKKERAAVEAVFTDASKLYATATKSTEPFLRGYEWGVNRTLKALGYTWSERWDIWYLATGHATRPDSHNETGARSHVD